MLVPADDKNISVYVIGSIGGPHKIGVANDPVARATVLQVASVKRLSAVFALEFPRSKAFSVERMSHSMLADRRVRGEWFDVSAAEAISAIRAAQEAVEAGQTVGRLAPGDGDKKLGRPALNVKETKVRLTDDQRARIEALVGPNKMAVFIREAVEAELARREQKPPAEKVKSPPRQ